MTQRLLSATNGFIPQATGQLIGFVRSESQFPVNSYVQLVESPATVGVYGKLNKDASSRIVTDADYVWADGADSPSGDSNHMPFEWVEFALTRRAYPFRIGNLAIKMAKNSWDPLAVYTKMVASQAMTNRTKRVITLAETASNWGTHVAEANSLNGGAGTWDEASDDPSSPRYNAIRKSLLEAANRIALDTNSVVQPDDLVLVISPGLAIRMANTGEIHNFLKYGPYSQEARDGRGNGKWGLPPEYCGFKIVVEDSVVVSTRPSADASAGTRGYVKSDSSAIMMSRKGGIDGGYGAPSFATFQVYWHEWQMAVYTQADEWHGRTEGKVVEHYKEVLTSSETGFLITNVLP